MDMSALEGITPAQLAAIAQLFQSGKLPLPQAGALLQTSAAAPSASPQVSDTANAQEEVDVDMEEGEVEEEDDDDDAAQPFNERDFLRPPPTGPRNRSASPLRPALRPDQRLPMSRSPVPVKRLGKNKQNHVPLNPSGQTNGHRTVSKFDGSKMFLLEMVKAGYTFEDITKEVNNPKPLHRLFKQLNLPVQFISTSTAPLLDGASAGAASDASKALLPKRSVAAKPAAIDRNEYLARLQAAKNKKPDPPDVTQPTTKPTDNLITAPEIPKPASSPKAETAAMANAPVASSSKAIDKTAIIRQRLEALKAQQAAKQDAAAASKVIRPVSSPVLVPAIPVPDRQTVSSPIAKGLGAGIGDIVAMVEQQASIPQGTGEQNPPHLPHDINMMSDDEVEIEPSGEDQSKDRVSNSAPVSPKPKSRFTPYHSAITGFKGYTIDPDKPLCPFEAVGGKCNDPSCQNQHFESMILAVTPETRSTVPPAPSRSFSGLPGLFMVPPDKPKPEIIKRPFGQSRGASEDESLVIEVSEDEDEDEDETDANLSSSTPGEGNKTPSGIIYEQKLRMIEDYKRRIAEKENKMKVANPSEMAMHNGDEGAEDVIEDVESAGDMS